MIQSIKKSIISRFIKLGQYAINSLGGETKAHYISPKGLYSRSMAENGLVLQILEDEGNKFVIPLQKAIDLKAGDVIITDDKNYIHFKFNDGTIEIQGDTTFNENVIINGTLHVVGKITSDSNIETSADVKAGSISLSTHVHSGVTTGPSNTGVPV